MERRWKVGEWGKNEREEWRGRKSREGVKEDERGRIRHTHLRKRLSTHSEVGKRCFYCSLMYVVICVWGRRMYPAIGSKSKCLSSEELGSVRHGKQSCGVHIFCTDPACICLDGHNPARQTGANCVVHVSVFPESILHQHQIYFIVLIIFNEVIHHHLKTFLPA